MSNLDKQKEEVTLKEKPEPNNKLINKEKSASTNQIMNNDSEFKNGENSNEKKDKYKGFIQTTNTISEFPLLYIFLFILFELPESFSLFDIFLFFIAELKGQFL